MTRSFLLISITMMLNACAGMAMVSDKAKSGGSAAQSFSQQTRVEAAGHKELCFYSKKGDEVFYRFEADGSVDFNLHYHIGEDVYYPVPAHITRAEKGQYVVPADDTYCLMWSNTADQPVELSVTVSGTSQADWF